MTIVTFTQEEMNRVAAWGTARTEENKNRRDIADYDKNRFNLTSEQANRLGVLVEYAVYKYLGFDPNIIDPEVWAAYVPSSQYKQHLGRPDVAGKYEARRANRRGNPIPIRSKDVRCEAIIIQGFVDYTQTRTGGIIVPKAVELTGWADAVTDYETGLIPSWSRNADARTVEPRSMETFNMEVAA